MIDFSIRFKENVFIESKKQALKKAKKDKTSLFLWIDGFKLNKRKLGVAVY